MRIFLSAGEPSGDLHGANLVRSLRQLRPAIDCVGFGGARMAAAGARLLYPLCRLAVMGVRRVLSGLPQFIRLLLQADHSFAHERPDAVVLIDFPGFNWWLAWLAHRRGIPVFYFVPPQLWAWAGWRVRKMRRSVDHVLCNLPFEAAWYNARGIPGHYIGHPYFDELAAQRLDEAFLAEQAARPGSLVALLPGSRHHEIENNLPTLLGAAAHIHAARPDTRFLVACLYPDQRDRVIRQLRGSLLPIEVHSGRTPEIIQLAHCCIAVSGSVSLELLYRGKPTVIVYRIRAVERLLARLLLKCRYITLVNLLADRELFPEFLSVRDEAEPVAACVLRWLNDPAAHAELCRQLAALRQQVALPGARARAAQFILEVLERKRGDGQQAA